MEEKGNIEGKKTKTNIGKKQRTEKSKLKKKKEGTQYRNGKDQLIER